MNDYKMIFNEKKQKISHIDLNALHISSVKYLSETILPGSIVVSHHAPLINTLDTPTSDKDFIGSPASSAFESNLQHLFQDSDPSLWIFGHTHFSTDFQFHKTRVFSHQVGYHSLLSWKQVI